MRNRFQNALAIQQGACNGQAVAASLLEAYKEAGKENGGTDAMNTDPAVQLILHQLCHLANISVDSFSTHPKGFDWSRATAICEERANAPAVAA